MTGPASSPRRWALLLPILAPAAAEAQGFGAVAGTVVDAGSRAPLSGVTVRAAGALRPAITRLDGTYRLELPAGSHGIRTRIIGYASVAESVAVRRGETTRLDFALQRSAVQLDELTAIGRRGGERTVTETPVPVDLVSADAMQSTGLIETWEALQRLVPSVNVPHVPRSDDHFRPVTLRGLAPAQVLILVNGKRRHPAAVLLSSPVLNASGLTDLNTIPTGAIERIEVLRDGAAAQYGSDAIAGVVNVVLKSGERREARSALGRTHTSEGGRAFRDGRLVDLEGTVGVLLGRGAEILLSARYRNRDGTNRAYPDLRTQYFAGDPRNENPPVISSHEGDGDVRDRSFMLSAIVPLGRHLEAYGFGGGADRDGTAVDLFVRPNDPRTVRPIHPDGFLPEIARTIRDASGVIGLRGTARGWRWDLSAGVGRSSIRYQVHGTNNVTLGAESPTSFFTGELRARQWTTNADLARTVDIGLEGPLTIGVGGELRRDGYDLLAGEPDSYRDGGVRILDGPLAGRPATVVGSVGMLGFRPADAVGAARHSAAGYLELGGGIAPWLGVDLAGRSERYSDFGSTTDGKLALRVEPIGGLALRGAIGTGFRAPSLPESWFANTRNILRLVNGVNTVYLVRTLPVHTPEARLLGAKPLRPETSRNLSAGIVLDVAGAPRLSADYYAIDIQDRIVLSGEFVDTSVTRLFEEAGFRGIAGGRYFTNAIDTETRGLDVVVQHGWTIDARGVLRLTGGYSHTRTRVTRVSATPPALSAFQSTLFNRVERGKIERGQPRTTFALTTNYRMGRLELNLHQQRFGEASLLDTSDPAADQTVRAKWLTDIGIAYLPHRRLRAAVSAQNLFDVYPDEWRDWKDGANATGMSINGIYRYPGGISPFGMSGRTVTVQLSYR
jgi:iron complex outermembrane receptor protein